MVITVITSTIAAMGLTSTISITALIALIAILNTKERASANLSLCSAYHQVFNYRDSATGNGICRYICCRNRPGTNLRSEL